MKKITKLLIANRGEIAIRVMRTARTMGISTVAVYSQADRDALFVSVADEAICIGGSHPAESYLDQDKIIAAAKQTGANAIHPGYGFLSENASFAQRCADEGIIFVGPSAAAIQQLGPKIGAKELMQKAGVPVVPGYNGSDQNFETFQKEAAKIGYPVLLKASAGGGGKGMRIVNSEAELEAAFNTATREAEKGFGSGVLLMEKYFPKAKHIEFQIFGDTHGNYVHLFERECSLQRRYQKVIEESPSPSISAATRQQMGDAAVAAARAVQYTNAGTVEFLYSPADASFYFLEVNTRLQVEHPVTEEVTGLDLVRLQLEVAQDLPLNIGDVKTTGHAIECRICAEDAENNFFPATGEILLYKEPTLKGLRFDSGVQTGSKVDVFYDSMLAKVIAYGETRTEAIQKMDYALQHYTILGITTNKDFLGALLNHPEYVDGSFDTKLIERDFSAYQKQVSETDVAEMAIAAFLYDWQSRKSTEPVSATLNGWRNIYYQSQHYILQWNGAEVKVEYRHKGDGCFDVVVGEICFAVELNSADAHGVVATINNHRKAFAMAIKNGEVFVQQSGIGTLKFSEKPRFTEPGSAVAEGDYIAPMPGEIVKVLVQVGDKIESGKALLVMNSMKMETTIEAHSDGEVEEVFVQEKTFVEAGTVMIKMK